jgi:hypothetical protein
MKQIHSIALLMLLQLVASSVKLTLQAEITDWFIVKFLTFRTQALQNGQKFVPEQSTWFWYITAGYHEKIRPENSKVIANININNQFKQEKQLFEEKSMTHENIVGFVPLDFSDFCQINLNFASEISGVVLQDDKFVVNIEVSCNLLQAKELEMRRKIKEENAQKRQMSMTKEDLEELVEENEEMDGDYDSFNAFDDPEGSVVIDVEDEQKQVDPKKPQQSKNLEKLAKKTTVAKAKPAGQNPALKEGSNSSKSDQPRKGASNPSNKKTAKSHDEGLEKSKEEGAGRKMKI